MSTKPPTTELGTTNPALIAPGASLVSWNVFVHDNELTPELVWPTSNMTYTLMRNDAQVDALLYGTFMPIRRYRWFIDPNGARDEVVSKIAEDFGLPVAGEKPNAALRSRRRFSHDKHLYHALLAMVYGHMYFEQVGVVTEDNLWRLRKLAPRMPSTISDIKVANDGGLEAIRQNVGMTAPWIPVTRLVAYIWDQEGANWVGRSMLRSLYKHWLLKDALLRVDALKHTRNGLGVPIVEAHQGASQKQLNELGEIAQQFKSGDAAGAALPNGARLRLVGTEGSVPDTLASIRYHDEQMARRFMMMFAQLGTTASGSRALGDSFVDFFGLAQQTVAEWYISITNEHVIEDWVDWNFGEEEAAPLIGYEVAEDPSLSIADLALSAEKGLLVVDEEMRTWFRESHRLPAAGDVVPPTPSPSVPTAAASAKPGVFRELADESSVNAGFLPTNARRGLYTQEVKAQVDFHKIESVMNGLVDRLTSGWKSIKQKQVEELAQGIANANGDVVEIARLTVTQSGKDLLDEELRRATQDGVDLAMAEAARQGILVDEPKMTALEKAASRRAEAIDIILGNSLADVAKRQALARTGPGDLTPEQVASEVATYISELSDSYLEDQLNGAVTQSIAAGRHEIMKRNSADYYASELLDASTCSECSIRDGMHYNSLADAEVDYPTGGYKNCKGGPRCRGTIVAVYEESA